MSNLITLNTPTAPEYLQGFIDRWTQGRQNAQQSEIQRGNLDVNRRNASVNEGQLQFQQGEAKDKGLKDESMGILKQVVQLKLANREADAKALVDQVKAQRPELVPHMGEIAAALVHTPADDEARNTQQVFTNDSQSVLNSTQPPPLQTTPMSVGENGNLVGGVNPAQPEMAPPNPQAMDRFHKRNFGNQGLSPQAMEDVQAQQPGAGGYDKALRRNVGDLTTAAQNQQSQTQINMEGMRQSGETTREKMKIDAAQAGMNSLLGQGAQGSATIETASPTVRALVNRSFDPMLMRRWKPEQVNAIVAAAQAIDPQFNMADYNAQYKAKQAFTSGPQSQAITSIGTVMKHLEALDGDLKSLDNGDYPMWNTAANWMSRQTGDPKVQKAMAAVNKDADAVANEMNKVMRGSGQMSEKETAAWRQGLGTSTTPAERRGAIEAAAKLLAGRVTEMAEAYKRGVGRPSDIDFLKTARPILQRMGLERYFASDAGAGQGTTTAAGASTAPADRQFIDSAMKITNPATGKPYTQAEAEAELQRRKGGA
jgi:hypothetical protein